MELKKGDIVKVVDYDELSKDGHKFLKSRPSFIIKNTDYKTAELIGSDEAFEVSRFELLDIEKNPSSYSNGDEFKEGDMVRVVNFHRMKPGMVSVIKNDNNFMVVSPPRGGEILEVENSEGKVFIWDVNAFRHLSYDNYNDKSRISTSNIKKSLYSVGDEVRFKYHNLTANGEITKIISVGREYTCWVNLFGQEYKISEDDIISKIKGKKTRYDIGDSVKFEIGVGGNGGKPVNGIVKAYGKNKYGKYYKIQYYDKKTDKFEITTVYEESMISKNKGKSEVPSEQEKKKYSKSAIITKLKNGTINNEIEWIKLATDNSIDFIYNKKITDNKYLVFRLKILYDDYYKSTLNIDYYNGKSYLTIDKYLVMKNDDLKELMAHISGVGKDSGGEMEEED